MAALTSPRKLLPKPLRRLIGVPAHYQDKRTGATEDRWNLIAPHLGPADRSLLDIGCNLGTLTRRAAAAGMVAVGFDIDPAVVARATRRHAGVPGLAFMLLEATPENLEKLPGFDVILCLSVHHYWVRAYGEATAWRMVATLAAKTRRRFFFEPASVRTKYGTAAPDFTDLDQDSIRSYNTRNLHAACGPAFATAFLGETPCLGRESFRLLFVSTRTEPVAPAHAAERA